MRQSISLRFLQGEREREIDIQAGADARRGRVVGVWEGAEGLC